MVAYRILFLAGAAAALPLNINLGAYSPALVVGMMMALSNMVPETLRNQFADYNVHKQVMVKSALEVITMCPDS